jgi:homoserine O-succinyltransferase
MPVTITPPSTEFSVVDLRERRVRRGTIRDRGKRLQVGLVNNMPDSALGATERQFRRLLEDASGEYDVELSFFSMESLPRESRARNAMAGTYRAVRELRTSRRDALIVTGAEPRAPDLREEPYWRELTALIDWANMRTHSSLFSCLAAHAAVLHRDGISRKRLEAKASGVFATEVVARNELSDNLGEDSATPHSRLNGLDQGELAAKGYVTVTRARDAGVDVFMKEGPSLSVFFQGHPEYEADTLAREYRRDFLRFLRGETPQPPQPPRNYFPPDLTARLMTLAERAATASTSELAALFPPEALDLKTAPWRSTSLVLFRNWLAIVARRKAASFGPSFATARWGG